MPTPRKPRRLCKNCYNSVKRPVDIYCNTVCQHEYHYQVFISQWLARKVDGGRIGGVSYYIRRHLIRTYAEQCSLCKWKERNSITGKVPLEVDHIDGNYRNNGPENLRLIYPNCHSLTPTFRGLNRGKGREQRKNASLVQRLVQ